MHDDVHLASLLFVYGLLLGNCGYQTDRKIYDKSENRSSLPILALSARCARDKIINSLRENEIISISTFFCTIVEPRFPDTHLIWTPVHSGQFRLFRH